MTRIPIADQIAEVERVARALERYPGRMKPETVAAKLERLAAAAASLRTIEAHADGLRMLIGFLKRTAAQGEAGAMPEQTETEILLDHPAVQAVLATFPEAVLVGISPSEPIAAPEPELSLLDA